MLLLLLASLASANDTGSLRFAYAQSGAVPDGVHTLAPKDAVSTVESRELLRLVSMDRATLAVDVLPPALGKSPDPTCASGAQGYLSLEAVAWNGTTTHESVQIADRGVDVASQSAEHSVSTYSERRTVGDFALAAQTTRPGVRATYTLQADAEWAIRACDGAVLRGWTDRQTVSRVVEATSTKAADAMLDPDGLRRTDGLASLADAAQRALSRGRGDVVSRRYYDAGAPELAAAAHVLRGSTATTFRERLDDLREHARGEAALPDETAWAAARKLWTALSEAPTRASDRGRVSAMARYDLALAAEHDGDFATAAREAHLANEALHQDWIAVYAAEMEAMAAVR